jgi:hypothetical protein|tara:strand:+ start:368 stop:844 length:477 start_codon:yes stop_codon:yes gene_type:complete
MAITAISDLDDLRTRVRLMAGIEQVELDNETLDLLISVASDWFKSQIGTTYTVGADSAYDNAVMYYSCYLSSIAQNGMGIERIQVGDLAVYYEGDQFIHFKELAEQELVMKQSLSIKTTTYNADPWLGDVNWNKNVTGVDATKQMYPVPKGTRGDGGY